jgi:hypothetical protein
MSERVSIKGLGQEIFFEDQKPPQPPEEAGEDGSSTQSQTRALPDVATSRRQGSSQPANERSSASTSEFFKDLVLPAGLRKRLNAAYRKEHPFHTTIRLSREDQNALRDICYELDSRMGLQVHRNDIGRIALRLLMEDYDLRKKESLLVQVLKEDD